MTKLQLLSAAVVATAMLATPAMASKSRANSRQLALDANASMASGVGSIDERLCHRAPAVGAFATAPWVQPPCEPAR
jgi:hypothetical protein